MAALLSVAYSASVGGAATLVGTGTNLAFKALVDGLYPNSPVCFLFYFLVCVFCLFFWEFFVDFLYFF